MPARLALLRRANNGQKSVLCPGGRGWSFSTLPVVADRLYVARFTVPEAVAATGIAFEVTAASGADDHCEAAIFNADLTRIASSGDTAGKLNAGGRKTLTFPAPVRLAPDVPYFAGLVAHAAGATLLTAAFGQWIAARLAGTAAVDFEMDQQAAAWPIPAGPLVLGVGSSQTVALRVLCA